MLVYSVSTWKKSGYRGVMFDVILVDVMHLT